MVSGRVKYIIEQCGTTTTELLRLVHCLLTQDFPHAALETTRVY